jgi:transitional endoplasmic reticulum ATPase
MRFFLENFERHYRLGIDLHRSGDLPEARYHFLKAAEYLLKLASMSEGKLRSVRKQKARQLIELAKTLPVEAQKKESHDPEAIVSSSKDGDASTGEKWLLIEKPNVRFSDVAGLEDVKATIRKRIIYPFEHPEVTKKYRIKAGGGVLLFGPPGTGKTMIAKAIATELDAAFFSVKCSDIMTKWVGEAEKNLRRLFDAARSYIRAVVFMDETEAIVSKRGGDSTVMNRVIPEFLAQVDGLDTGNRNFLLLGATNRPWDIDEAALRTGRFGELIYVGLPDVDAREAILRHALEGVPISGTLDIRVLAGELEGFSGADLVGFVEAAKSLPYEREIKMGTPQEIGEEDIEYARKKARRSVSDRHLTRYQKFLEGR